MLGSSLKSHTRSMTRIACKPSAVLLQHTHSVVVFALLYMGGGCDNNRVFRDYCYAHEISASKTSDVDALRRRTDRAVDTHFRACVT